MTKQEFLAMSYPYEIKLIYRNDKSWPIIMAIGNLDEILHTNKDYKPILHPLSDLTKEIEHKGERFVPSMILSDLWIDYGKTKQGGDSTQEMFYRWFSGIEAVAYPFYLVQKLIEWHFDIADLISKGEAIDVNTLGTNPYK